MRISNLCTRLIRAQEWTSYSFFQHSICKETSMKMFRWHPLTDFLPIVFHVVKVLISFKSTENQMFLIKCEIDPEIFANCSVVSDAHEKEKLNKINTKWDNRPWKRLQREDFTETFSSCVGPTDINFICAMRKQDRTMRKLTTWMVRYSFSR